LRYGQVFDKQTSWQIQTYYDHATYSELPLLSNTRDTWDIDLQYQFSPADCHDVIVGANYRRTQDDIPGSFYQAFVPVQFLTQWASVFAQDTIELEQDRWYFTLGCRLEYNTFGKFQPEPTARLLFLPSDRQSMWVAVSRAARNPTRAEEDLNSHINVVPGAPVFLNVLGNPDAVAEDLVAYEVGYRAAPTDNFSWDIAGYINDYRNEFGTQPVAGPLTIQFANNIAARSYGGEVTATYQCNPCWRLFGSYSLFEINVQGATDPIIAAILTGASPNNEIYLRSSWDFGRNVQWDLIGRYVDSLTGIGVPSYFQLDTRIGWQLTKNMEVSFVGQNLLDGHHLEFIDTLGGLISTEVKRSWYGMLTCRF
jgi:iron complex outermembrane receptor protein